MAPKKKLSKAEIKAKAKAALSHPTVSAEAIKKAEEFLKSEEEAKRQRANLAYYLEQHGAKDEYQHWSGPSKRDFLLVQVAKKIEDGKLAAEVTTARQVEFRQESDYDWHWMGKQEMINTFGEQKALGKIESGKLQTQPDPDTGEHGEWITEYKVHKKKGTSKELDTTSHGITGTESGLEGSAASDAFRAFEQTGSHFASATTDTSGGPPCQALLSAVEEFCQVPLGDL